MVLENLVVGWPYVQRASYISKHRPRTVDFLIVDQFLVNAFSTLVSQGGTRNLLNGADCATKSLSWQHGHVGEMVERNCVLRQPFVWAGHAQGLAIIANNNLVAWAWAVGPGHGQAALGMKRRWPGRQKSYF